MRAWLEERRRLLPSNIAQVSVDSLADICRDAANQGRSAVGRPDWLAAKREQVTEAYIHVFGLEASSTFRCIATVILADESRWYFTVDMQRRRFRSLESLSKRQLRAMALRHLGDARHVPLSHITSEGGP